MALTAVGRPSTYEGGAMRWNSLTRAAVLAAACLTATLAQAGVLFRAGDYAGTYGAGGEMPDGSIYTRWYKDFTVGGSVPWTVTALGNLGAFQDDAITGRTAYWEIRQGIGPNNPGMLVASGTGDITGLDLITQTGNGGLYDYEVALDTALSLDPGSYWVAVSPYFGATDGPRVFQALTWGANGVGGPAVDGTSYITDYHAFVPSLNGAFTRLSNRAEAAITVYGTVPAAVPEPGSLSLAGLGLAGVALWRRRFTRARPPTVPAR